MIRNSHRGSVNSKSCQTNLISFSDGVIGLVDRRGEGADAIYLDFIKAPDIAPGDVPYEWSWEESSGGGTVIG